MASYMKGPWEVGDYEWPNGTISYNILGPEATRYREGNRLLIESAPDLLEALKAIAACPAHLSADSLLLGRIRDARAAIAKAEGKS